MDNINTNYYISNGEYYLTGDAEKTKNYEEKRVFKSLKTAENVLKTLKNRKLKDFPDYKIMPIADGEAPDDKPYDSELDMDWFETPEKPTSISKSLSICEYNFNLEGLLDTLNAIENIMENINAGINEQYKIISQKDKETQDVLHFIELNRFDVCKGFKLCKLLKQIRLERREAKDKLNVLESICNSTGKKFAGSLNYLDITKTIKGINKLDNRSYTEKAIHVSEKLKNM